LRPQTRKVKLEPFLIFNQQFLTLIRAGCRFSALCDVGQYPEECTFCRQLEDVSPA